MIGKTLLRMPKWALALGIVAVVMVAYLALTPVYADWADGAPTAMIKVQITELDTGTMNEIELPLDNPTMLEQSLTAYTATFPAPYPTKPYSLKVIFTTQVSATGDIELSCTGVKGGSIPLCYANGTTPANPVFKGQITAGAPTPAPSPTYTHWYYNNAPQQLLGMHLADCSFTFSLTATGLNAEGAYSVGQTTGTLTLLSGPTGTIDVQITGISTDVQQTG